MPEEIGRSTAGNAGAAIEGPDNVLEMENICKTFGAVQALRAVDVWVKRGEVTAVVGDNGAGKSTLVKCIAGLHVPDSGSIRVDGKQVEIGSVDRARELGIETVYQDLALVDDLSVAQNLFLNRELVRRWGPVALLDRAAMRREATKLLSGLGVNVPAVTARTSSLSGGQRQAIAIARGMHWGRRLVILDEPTAALGVQETRKVENLVGEVVGMGTSVLMVSHNVDQVMRLASTVWVMRRGEVAGVLNTASCTGPDIVALITGAA